jgi:hypothetical protein
MIINENAKRGIFLATPNEIITDIEKDYTNKIQLSYLIRLVKNDATLTFYSMSLWQNIREKVRQRDHYECQRCAYNKRLRTSIKSGDLHVHHICELEKFPELALNLNNLITVCHECHNIIHDRFQDKPPEKPTQNYDSTEWFI